MKPRIASLIAAFLTGLPCYLQGAEPWADSRLPVSDSLELWLDASREREAREALKLAPVDPGRGLDYWHDGSGQKRDVRQLSESARPHWRTRAGSAFVRFDGENDFLSASPAISLSNLTVILFAAPSTNAGRFSGFIAWNKEGRNDYRTGFNIDFGSDASARWETISVEGRGISGQRNLMQRPVAFNAFHTLAVTSTVATNGTRLRFDGVAHGRRDRQPGTLDMDELVIAARLYDTETRSPGVDSYWAGEMAEVLIYSRVLTESELRQTESYLKEKHAGLLRVPDGGAIEKNLEAIKQPPPVQMLVPGFSVRELPLDLNNINNLVYAPDGRLFALAYDGNVWQLEDVDGDGLEERATLFWNNSNGEVLATIGMTWGPGGLYLPNKGRILHLRDEGNGTATLQVVNSGWVPPTQMGGSTLDAIGITADEEGNVYFGLGADKWSEPYIVDSQSGRSRYQLDSERGCIIRLTPSGQRERLATGLRWPCALALHPNGDLFCLDQEGATWLPNGNPFDELLHIQKGRHYGFPPRHPKYLPDVIDEPNIFDFAPQHQSTCSIHFNVPAPNKEAYFGPAAWLGDALVSGESRGKLWRTRLVKTDAGYVAHNQLIGCLSMLTIDAVVTPSGDLLATCHSGAPDWGTGPKGKGKLYKISYTDRAAPQPLFAYAASPTETRVVFDRRLKAAGWSLRESRLESGRHVSAGDRFESIRPGYQVVVDQMNTPRFEHPVLSAGISLDQVSLQTAPRLQAVRYAVTLPGIPGGTTTTNSSKLPPQVPAIDLGFELSGVEAQWESQGSSWQAWLPHLDLNVAKALTAESAEHREFLQKLNKSGRLVLHAQLDLWRMLRPAIQPGAKIDYEYAPETVTVVFRSSAALHLTSTGNVTQGRDYVQVSATPEANRWLPIEISLEGTAPWLTVWWFTAEDSRPRALALRRIFLPWAQPESGQAPTYERRVPEIAGGNWLHGKRLFNSAQLACGRCHTAHGEGGRIGPDLSNLIQRDYASVLKDITQPSAAINPDHVAYLLETRSGDGLTVLPVKESSDSWLVADATGQTTNILKEQIASLKPSAVSLMPEGLLQPLASQQVKDLLSFLLLPAPLEPASIDCAGEPPARARQEIAPLLNAEPLNNARPLRLIFCAAPKDHGPGEHDYPLWQKRWMSLFSLADNVKAEAADVWPSAEQMKAADVLLFYSNNPGWNLSRAEELDRFLARGGGLVLFHWAVNGGKYDEALSQRIGLSSTSRTSYRHGPIDLQLRDHPLTAGFPTSLKIIDETYWKMTGDLHACQLVGDAVEEGSSQPQLWTRQIGRGRLFVSIPGHYTWTFDDPVFRVLALRGIAWTAGEPIDRFVELATIGARVAD